MLQYRILHSVASLSEDKGGPSRTVPSLCEALADTGQALVSLVTARSANNLLPPPEKVAAYEVPAYQESRWIDNCKAFTKVLSSMCLEARVQLIHDHGQWLGNNRAAAKVSRDQDLPRIVSPRGMLSPWSLRYRRWRKRLAWLLFARRDLQSAQVIHATSELEARELRLLGVRSPIAVIPNGVEILSCRICKHDLGYRRALFVSRIHPKKGLLNLIDAWSQINTEGWELLIAGPDECGHAKQVRERIAECRAANVRVVGPVQGQAKQDLFSSADLFVLPSYSENFGVVVAEALAAGVAVITTHGTPWALLEQERCGWWIPPEVQHLRDALVEAMSMDVGELHAMGGRGQDVARRAFSWNAVATQMLEVYRWQIVGGSFPSTVWMD